MAQYFINNDTANFPAHRLPNSNPLDYAEIAIQNQQITGLSGVKWYYLIRKFNYFEILYTTYIGNKFMS
jgi:hypothetical protein